MSEQTPIPKGVRVVIDYTNWRGGRSEREITSEGAYFGANEWHTEPQWLLVAWDHGRNARRTFALAGIHSWRLAKGETP